MAQWIYSTGCVCAVGLDAAQACAAIQARQSGIVTSVAQAGDPLMAAPIPASERLKKSRSGWHLHVALRALRECLPHYSGQQDRLALFIALPEPLRAHRLTGDGTGHRFVAQLVRALGMRLSAHSRVLLDGHASAAMAMEAAEQLLRRNEIDAAVIGGIDSLINDADEERLRGAGRRHEPSNPFGLIPGEAAAFFMTGRDSGPFTQPPIAGVLGAATAVETQHLRTDRYSVGQGLQQAIRTALQRAGMDEARIEWRVTDINGERHRAWESTALLARQYRAWRDGLPCLFVPAFTGDVGCASLPLQVIVGAHAMQSGHAPGPVAVCESCSEGPMRGACLIAPAPGAPQPPFRMIAAAGSGVQAGAIAQIAMRLPHELGWLAQHRHQLTRGSRKLKVLLSHDQRLDAHMALLRTMGPTAWRSCLEAVDEVGPGGLFAPALLAIEAADPQQLASVVALSATMADDPGVTDALAWAPTRQLRGLVAAMATSSNAGSRELAAAAMHVHRVQPGPLLAALLEDPAAAVRARALVLAGEVGAVASLDAVIERLRDENPEVRFRAAWAATLLGRGDLCHKLLSEIAIGPGPHAPQAAELLLRTSDSQTARHLIRQLAGATGAEDGPALTRRMIDACAAAGDPAAVPWLIKQMDQPAGSRAAGEAFAQICGVELGEAGLEGPAPEADESDESDEGPADDRLIELDDGLAWPDASKVSAWWSANAHRFEPGRRYFLGQPPSADVCMEVLREGQQRRRILAALQLRVMQPESRLFPTAAPAWRQQRWLASAWH